jgi:hypothetical protein
VGTARVFPVEIETHIRRELLWFAVTRNPTAEWLAQQIVEAFPWNTAPTYLVRDNDGAYGHAFTSRVRAMGIRDRPIAPRSHAIACPKNRSQRYPARLPRERTTHRLFYSCNFLTKRDQKMSSQSSNVYRLHLFA